MNHPASPRITPKPIADWDNVVIDALGAFPAGLNFVLRSQQEGEEHPRGVHVLGALAHHPPLAKAFLTFNAYVATATSLAPRLRELVILRISWLKHSEYEFAQHLILGRRAGLSEQELEQLQADTIKGDWPKQEEFALCAVDQLHAKACVSTETWTALQRHFSDLQLMDLLFLAGCYATLGMVLNTIGLSLEPSIAPLSDLVRTRLHASRVSTQPL